MGTITEAGGSWQFTAATIECAEGGEGRRQMRHIGRLRGHKRGVAAVSAGCAAVGAARDALAAFSRTSLDGGARA